MDASTRTLLRTLATAGRTVGSANDLDDRGGADEAERMRAGARQSIADALEAASEDDRARVEALFGPDPEASFDRISWSTSEDYIAFLLERDPELPVAALRDRLAGFERRIDDLRAARDVPEARMFVRYGRRFSPSMFDALRKLVGRNGDLPGWFRIGRASYHLNLQGDGLRDEVRPQPPEPSDVLVEDVWIHVEMDIDAARTGVPVTLRARDGDALQRIRDALAGALAAAGWEELPVPP